jgi:hypothetical protein
MTAPTDGSTPLERVLAETGILRSLRSALKPGPGQRQLILSAAVAAEFRWQLGQLISDMDAMRVVRGPAPRAHPPPRPGNVDRSRLTLTRSDR